MTNKKRVQKKSSSTSSTIHAYNLILNPFFIAVGVPILIFTIYFIYYYYSPLNDADTIEGMPASIYFSIPPDSSPLFYYPGTFWESIVKHTFIASSVLLIPFLFPIFILILTLEFTIFGLFELFFNFQGVKTFILTYVSPSDVICMLLFPILYLSMAYDSHLLSPYYWISLFNSVFYPSTVVVDESVFITALEQYQGGNTSDYIVLRPTLDTQVGFILITFMVVGMLSWDFIFGGGDTTICTGITSTCENTVFSGK